MTNPTSVRTRKQIDSLHRHSNIILRHMDGVSLTSIRDFVDEYVRDERRLDVLVNNAEIFLSNKKLNVQRFELHFAYYLGRFLLTNLLMDSLKVRFSI